MKNRKVYERAWKRQDGEIVSYSKEAKRDTLYCFWCHRYRSARLFPHETGYGTTNRTQCADCEAKPKTRCRRLYNKIVNHYGGYICARCNCTHKAALEMHHVHFNGKACRIEACGSQHQHRRDIYYRWVIRNDFPEKHHMAVLCTNCHVIVHKDKIKL